jgi:serine/threonine protein kinase
MDLYEEGDFENYLLQKKNLSYEDFIDFSIQICSAMSYLHEKKIIHRLNICFIDHLEI